jgi:putative transposase
MANQEKQPEALALWRFGTIAGLLHREPDGLPLCAQISRLAKQGVCTLSGERKYLSPDTLRGWLSRYRNLGLAGLTDRVRKDKQSTSVAPDIQDAFRKYRKEHPFWTVKRILRQLRDTGVWDGRKPGWSSFYRFVTVHGLRRNLDTLQPQTEVHSFEYPNFGDLWMADFLHGPRVRIGVYTGKAYLHAIIDDATRYIVAARFHTAEDTEALIDDLMLAVRRFGVPRRFYTDNGAAFRSKHLRLIAARLSIGLPHTPPGRPRGRGKIERWFRSVRDQFLTGKDTSTLAKLNEDLQKFIALYHQTVHTALEMSPLNRKDIDQGPPLKQIDPIGNIDALFQMETEKTVQADGCIRLRGSRYEIKDALPGQKVQISYLPWDKSTIWAGENRIPVKPLNLYANAVRFQHP